MVKKEVAIPVPAADNTPMEEDKPLKKPPKELKDAPIQDELSEEDQELKSQLEMLVERLKESDTKLYGPSLETMKTLILTSTSSMTSVPKPLKFLRPLYPDMEAVHDSWPDSADKKFLADILSILAMTYDNEKLDTLKYRQIGSGNAIGSWGHEYVKHLTTEIGLEYAKRQEKDESSDDLVALALEVAPFFLSHNAEADAVDLLLQLDIIPKLVDFVDINAYKRVCLYLTSCVNYLESPDDHICLRAAHDIYLKHGKYAEATLVAIRLNDKEMIQSIFDGCDDPLLKKQLAFMLARQQLTVETEDEELQDCLNNTHLSSNFLQLARELDLMEPKTPEDIYKTHLEHKRPTVVQPDSARQNLASTFVNAFVNAGFCTDKLMLNDDPDVTWIYKNKEHGMLSASASLGMLLLWDVEMGLAQIDRFMWSHDENVRAGALLAMGIVNSGVRNSSDPALAVLSEHLDDTKSVLMRVAAIQGLGLAYAGSAREELSELLLPIVSNSDLTMELASYAALSLGMVFVGTCDGEITSTILQTMLERSEGQLSETFGRFMALGLALLHVGARDQCEVTLETLKAIEHPIGKRAAVLVEVCAYAGSGDVLRVQRMLHFCNDHIDTSKDGEDDEFQAYAVLGIALIALGEDIGSEMALRSFTHLMHYGEPVIRRAVPLAIGLLCASNPVLTVLDTLGKYSHDNDVEVAVNSIFAMGMIGAGTNNARIAQMLRHLASYYHKDANCLFIVRIAQGLLHMGKGTLTINPLNSDRQIMSPVAIAGLLTTVMAFTDVKTLVLGRHHSLLYSLVTAMYPRFLITLNEKLEPEPVTVRVGQAVDVVGQAGRPKTITGFQTHSTPVLLAYSERAELSTEEYLAQTPVLEGFVLLKKNPDYVEESKV
ncbi:proteasome regulatory particle base subunit [Actinomortierella ambigua]|nr:proteasome regulatory particle base subunit [Actinomortierella ambigua]